MRIISRKALKDFWGKHPDSEQSLRAWFAEAKKASWNNFNEIKLRFPSASIVGKDIIVFNIRGNTYRLIVRVLFTQRKIFIRFVGSHKEYDKADIKNI